MLTLKLYKDGEAFIYEITAGHVSFCDDLATRFNEKVYIPLYPLEPKAKRDETCLMIDNLIIEGEGNYGKSN